MQRVTALRVEMKTYTWNKQSAAPELKLAQGPRSAFSPHLGLPARCQPYLTQPIFPCYFCDSVHPCKLNYFSSFSDFKYSSSWSRSVFHEPPLLFELIPFCSVSPLIGTCDAFKGWNPIPVNFIDSFQGLLISYANSCLFQKEKTKQPFGENAFKICKEPLHSFSQLWMSYPIFKSLSGNKGRF